MTYRELDVLEMQCKELVALVGEFEADDWDRPTRCTGWTVMDICAHMIESAERVGGLARLEPKNPEPNTDRVRWWRMPNRTDPKVLLDSAKDVSAAIPPADRLRRLEDALWSTVTGLRAVGPDKVIGNEWRTLTARELAANRCLEFGVHTMDLGHATLRGERIHPDAAQIVKEILLTLLGEQLPIGLGWDTRTLVLTGTGRRQLLSNERFVLGPLADAFPIVK